MQTEDRLKHPRAELPPRTSMLPPPKIEATTPHTGGCISRSKGRLNQTTGVCIMCLGSSRVGDAAFTHSWAYETNRDASVMLLQVIIIQAKRVRGPTGRGNEKTSTDLRRTTAPLPSCALSAVGGEGQGDKRRRCRQNLSRNAAAFPLPFRGSSPANLTSSSVSATSVFSPSLSSSASDDKAVSQLTAATWVQVGRLQCVVSTTRAAGRGCPA